MRNMRDEIKQNFELRKCENRDSTNSKEILISKCPWENCQFFIIQYQKGFYFTRWEKNVIGFIIGAIT